MSAKTDGPQEVKGWTLTHHHNLAFDPSWLLAGEKDPDIKEAMRGAVAVHWAPRAEDSLIRNDVHENRRPDSWRAVERSLKKRGCGLARCSPYSQNQPGELRADLIIPSMTKYQQICLSVGIDARDATPSTAQWIGSTAWFLLGKRKISRPADVCEEDFLNYGRFMTVITDPLEAWLSEETLIAFKEQVDLGTQKVNGPALTTEELAASILKAAELTGLALSTNKQ